MEQRKKVGIGYLIGGFATIFAGGIMLGTEATPDWVPLVMQGIGLIANLLGFTSVYPDIANK